MVELGRFEALIYSDYHEARWKLAGAPKESIDLQEAHRWMHRSEDLVLEIAKTRQRQAEILGLILILFPKTDDLQQRIDRITHFKSPKILGEPFKMELKELEEWKVKAVEDLQRLVVAEYGEPVDGLLKYLENEIRKM